VKVSDHVIQCLREWGVQRIYGYTGDAIDGLLAAFDRAGNNPQWIPTPHEEVAGLMACAHAKFTGTPGVCMATSGPGAIHLLNGLYDAKLESQPVVAIVGQQSRMSIGGHYQQEIDLHGLFKDVASAYIQTLTHPAQVRHLVDRAFRVALAERTVTCLIVPHDIQEEEAIERPPHEHGAVHSGPGYAYPRVIPADTDLRRAAAVLNAGQRVAMLVGAGTLQATDEVIAVADRLGAGVAKALLGKAAVPDDLPFVTGSAGFLGTGPSNWMLANCDTLLLVGTTFPYTEYLPEEGTVRGVQIDLQARMLSLRYPMEVALHGDSAETLRALLPLLDARSGGGWRAEIEHRVKVWRSELERRAHIPADPLNPQLVFHELSPRLPDDVILTGDSGSSTVWYARYLQMRRGMLASLSGTLATMGSALPYALAAKMNFPARPVLAISGDGAMQMIGINALISVTTMWREWVDPRFIVLVLNNRDLNYVTWEQRLLEGAPKFEPSQDLFDFPFAAYAESLGLLGIRIDAPEQVGPVLDRALAADRPVLIEAVTDPAVPPVPPELTEQLEEQLDRALAKGDPEAAEVEEQVERQDVRPDSQ
jgi:pyruvate dehydrogenase (quinone)